MGRSESHYYESLYQVAKAINSVHGPDEVLHSIVELVAQAMGAKGCSLILLVPEKNLLVHTAAHGLSDWYVRKGPLSADKSISEALSGKPVAILDATEDERVQYREQAKKEGITSILSVPMLLRDEIIGVIRVYTSILYHFTIEDIRFVSAVTNLGAVALENARLYDAVQKDYEEFRQEMLAWRAALGNEWMLQESVAPREEAGVAIPPGG